MPIPRHLVSVCLVLLSVCVLGGYGPSVSAAAFELHDVPVASTPSRPWSWPVSSRHITRAYVAPAHTYGPGHRGIDVAAEPNEPILAPAAGVVAFVGTVVDRGVLTIEHGEGVVSSWEPVTSDLVPGQHVSVGDPVALLASGGHAASGSLHVGVRVDGDYVNPLLFFGGLERAILLPCC